ncbi:MAG: DUF2914 domain-containing protein [Bdellovibrionales bacterium]|nr:DUF2914 domain-containing protein [Bdellovibrionales bacterium]
MLQAQRERFKAFYAKYERYVPIAAFLCGFLFDMAMLHRIDEPAVMIQQALYLIVTAVLIAVDLIGQTRDFPPPRFFTKAWRYREFLLHFFLGTLLNSYTIFYFKSASGITSFIFIFLLIAALTISEFKRFGEAQHQVHMALWSLCLISYCQSLLPILMGFMGLIPFLLSGILSILIFALYFRIMRPKLELKPDMLFSHLLVPYATVHAFFSILYFTHAIPPVPLSVQYMGIYHGIEKSNGEYVLSYSRPWYKFWQHGDETFEARPGDTVIAFMQIFSPGGFSDQLKIRWSLYDPRRGWQSQDAIPLSVTGGREEGFRAFTKKANYQPGKWRVQVETMGEHEVGRLTFSIEADPSTDERTFKTEVR